MQFTIEEVHAVQPWAIRNATGNRHISKFFATQQEAQTFANRHESSMGKDARAEELD
jgi:hypothetical protein